MSDAASSAREYIVILGSENLEDGTLSPMAAARCEEAVVLHRETGAPLITTGGVGDFNPTRMSHAFWMLRHLTQLGVRQDSVRTLDQCNNTVADLVAVRNFVTEQISNEIEIYGPQVVLPSLDRTRVQTGMGVAPRVTIVTSDYHVPRAGIIAETIFPSYIQTSYVAAPTILQDSRRREALLAHEGKRIGELLGQGGVFLEKVRDGISVGRERVAFGERVQASFPDIEFGAAVRATETTIAPEALLRLLESSPVTTLSPRLTGPSDLGRVGSFGLEPSSDPRPGLPAQILAQQARQGASHATPRPGLQP